MKRRFSQIVLAGFATVLLSLHGPFGLPDAHAIPVGITGYDILNADVSGTGNWYHSYTGVITPTGGSLANYVGGTGTMADGVLAGTDETNTQLFLSDTNQVIALFLDGFYSINQIDIYGGDHGTVDNAIPGRMDGMDISISAFTQTFATVPFGPWNYFNGNQINDSVMIGGSALDGLFTNQILISNVTSTYGNNAFSIAEIVIDGDRLNAVPEPSTLLLLGSGMVGLGFVRRKFKR